MASSFYSHGSTLCWLIAISLCLLNAKKLHAAEYIETPLILFGGYRFDQLTFKVKDNEGDQQFLSEQSWPKIQSYTLGMQIATCTARNVFYKFRYAYADSLNAKGTCHGLIMHRKELAHWHNPSGKSYHATLAVGLPIWINCWAGARLTPQVGYIYDTINIKNEATLTAHMCATALHSQRHLKIKTPLIGLDLSLPFGSAWRFFASYEYLCKGSFHSHGKIATRRAIERFTAIHANHKGKGQGQRGCLSLGYQFWYEWGAALTLQYSDWKATSAHGTVQLDKAGNKHKHSAHLRDLTWRYLTLTLDLVMIY